MRFTPDNTSERQYSTFQSTIYPRLVELWIFVVILIFFVVRVLNSQMGHHILNKILHRQSA